MNDSNNLLVIAGEVSGDIHGSYLIRELLRLNPDIRVFGIGGDKMTAAGMQCAYHISKMAFLGFTEVIKHLPFIRQVQNDLIALIKERNIKEAVLIDYPGFNLNFARKLKKLGVKVIYYISPQIWAWGEGRIKKIKALVDKMIVILPFEKDYYLKAGVNAEFVGHPLVEQINEYPVMQRDEVSAKFGLDASKDILLILPGSRKHEVESLLPETLKAAELLCRDFNMQTVVAGSSHIPEEVYENYKSRYAFTVVTGHTYDLMKYAKFGLIKSGTSTLEAGMFSLPMVVIYKTSRLTYIIGRSLIKVRNIGLVNIISGSNVVPELIQDDVNAAKISAVCREYLADESKYNFMKEKLTHIKDMLGTEGASGKAAQIILAEMNAA